MRLLLAALAVPVSLLVSGVTAGAAQADQVYSPPFIDHATWAHWGDLSSLRVYPTPSGRKASGVIGTRADGDEAWTEVLALAPDADIPGMREQFVCHWQLAELGNPGKTSWNLEPWRPVVDGDTMINTNCNPGGTEEPF
ncbi:MAG: DUF2599 domain-containing protein [Mycobacterium sp.]